MTDLGTPAVVSMVVEYALYLSAAALLVIAVIDIATSLDQASHSAKETDRLGSALFFLDARFHFTWALLEACLAFLLAAIGIGLNHLRYAATVLKNLYNNP